MEEKKTHTERKNPQMSVRSLADYMAASERAKRTVVRDCKFRATVKVVQHDEAKLVVAEYIRAGGGDPELLRAKAEFIRNKLATDIFESDVNDHNADYVDSFADVVESLLLPSGAELISAKQIPAVMINGVRITLRPDLMLRKVSKKTNKAKAGALMLRYKKGAALQPKVGPLQSAAILGVLRMQGYGEDAEEEADRALCLTLDAFSATTYDGPTDSVTIFNNMKAACATIADCWANVKPPPKAVI